MILHKLFLVAALSIVAVALALLPSIAQARGGHGGHGGRGAAHAAHGHHHGGHSHGRGWGFYGGAYSCWKHMRYRRFC